MINRRNVVAVLTVYIAFVFVQSLFFKFTNSPETQYIFDTLNEWVLSLGAPPLFAPNGLFSQYVIGSAELVASSLLLVGLLTGRQLIHALGALMSLGVISGAITFHLFTPLGVSVKNADGSFDGGQLFALACGVWISAAIILWVRRDTILAFVPGFAPSEQ